MKFTVTSSAFSSRLMAASKVLLSKNTMPILECFLLDVKNGHVSVTASDGEKFFTARVPLIDCDNNMRLCVPARVLTDSIKELPEQPVTIDYSPESMEVRVSHQSGYFTLTGQDASTFPECKAVEEAEATELSLTSDVLIKGISLCLNATADDEIRLIMTCIYLDVHEDNITFAATDGRKLVRYVNRECAPGLSTSLIVQKKVASVLKGTLEAGMPLTLKFDKTQAVLHTSDIDFSFRLIEGNYLNYNAVIPTNNPYRATVDRASLLGAVRRVSVCCMGNNGLTKIHLENGLIKLTSQDIDYGRNAEENLLCEYSNTPINIGLNCFYVQDMISVLEAEHICLQLADSSRPALLTPMEQKDNEDVTMLIMPMMLND